MTTVPTPYVLDFEKVFNDYMAQNVKFWSHDRSTTLGASEAFDCMRKLVYEKRGAEFGAEPDEDYVERWGAMERGNIIENNFVVPAMAFLPDGLSFHLGGTHQVTHVLSRNSATPDGLITGLPSGPVEIRYKKAAYLLPEVTTGCIGLEIKSIDPRAVLEEERVKHHYQAQVGLGMIRETTSWRPEYWVILYIDASWLDDITPFVVAYEPSVFETAKRRAEKIWEFEDPLQAVPEGKFDGGCKYCRWKRACGTAIAAQITSLNGSEELDPIAMAEADALARDVIALRDKAKEATEEHERVRQELREWLIANRHRRVSNENWSVSWSTNAGKPGLNTKAMEDDGIDLEKYKTRGAPFDVLRVIDRNKE